MDRADTLEFVNRNHRRASDAKCDFWVSAYCEHGAEATWRASQGLLAHIRSVQPGYPDARDRDSDLQGHVALKARIDRTADAFARR